MFTTAELLQLIESIYAGILDSAAWEAAIGVWCRAFGGERAALSLHRPVGWQVAAAAFVNVEPSFRDAYAGLIARPDMSGAFRAVAVGVERGGLAGDEVAQAAPDLERSRFHAEWRMPQRMLDMIAVPLAPSPSLVGGLFIARTRRGDGYGDRELDALRALRPHLLRAVQVRQRLQHLECAARDVLAALELVEQGVVLVDSRAVIVHANSAASAVLGSGDGIGTTRAVLTCDGAEDTRRLHRLVGEAATDANGAGGPLAVRRRSGKRPLSILVAPLRGERPMPLEQVHAMVLIADPEAAIRSPAATLCQLYDLTAAEARTAEALFDHAPLADIAGKLDISLATVRTLLQRTFEKTDTHSQAELVHLMLAHRLPIGSAAGASRPPSSSSRTSPPP